MRLAVTVLGFAAVVALGIVWVDLTHTRPSFDAFGWLVWGKQVVHSSLNLDGAPSWKPLTFLFTLPYALFGHSQITLWTATASAAAIAGAVFAARIAYRWTGAMEGPAVVRRLPALLAGAFAGAGILGINGLSHQMLIATSDPMVMTFCLAAVDCQQSGRPRLGFACIVLASLGRPETWPFAGLYVLWAWRAVPRMRWLLILGVLLIPAGWFVIPGLTSRSWFIAGDLALKFPGAVHGSKLIGVTDRFLGLYELPMKIAVVGAIILAALRRAWTPLLFALAAFAWVAVEIAFAYHGWAASPRYMLEAAAMLVAVAGAGVGWALKGLLEWRGPLRLAGPAAVAVLLVALAPVASGRVRQLNAEVVNATADAVRIDRLPDAVAAAGGAVQVRACGQPVTFVGFQSTLAYDLGMNVGDVGYRPGKEIRKGVPIVLFKPTAGGWAVRPIHWRPGTGARCRRLSVDVGFGVASLRGVQVPAPILPPFPPGFHPFRVVRPRHHAGHSHHPTGSPRRPTGRSHHPTGRSHHPTGRSHHATGRSHHATGRRRPRAAHRRGVVVPHRRVVRAKLAAHGHRRRHPTVRPRRQKRAAAPSRLGFLTL